MDNLKTIVRIELDFMGFKEYEFIHAGTGNKITAEINLMNTMNKINEVVSNWTKFQCSYSK
jgi:FMN-dependent NADH-azoreductase